MELLTQFRILLMSNECIYDNFFPALLPLIFHFLRSKGDHGRPYVPRWDKSLRKHNILWSHSIIRWHQIIIIIKREERESLTNYYSDVKSWPSFWGPFSKSSVLVQNQSYKYFFFYHFVDSKKEKCFHVYFDTLLLHSDDIDDPDDIDLPWAFFPCDQRFSKCLHI